MQRLFFCLIISYNLSAFQLGLESLTSSDIKQLSSQKIALVTNQTGRDQAGNRSLDVLTRQGIAISYLCAPEHGLYGNIPAGKGFGDCKDSDTGIAIVSLYKQDAHRAIDPQLLSAIDTFIFDIQDAGMRHYTYISTLYKLLEAAIKHAKKVVVLDRPNLLGPVMEGPLVDSSLLSFIGIAPIPLRHGMTVGELARYFNRYFFNNQAHLKVVPMKGYRRDMKIDSYWPAPLSPNIPTRAAAYGYSFLGLLGEVGPFDVGVRTTYPFQIIALPNSFKIDPCVWDQLRTVLKNNHVESSWFHYMHPIKNMSYVGLKISIPDISRVSTMKTFIAVLDFFKKNGITFEFKTFDKSIGTLIVRNYLMGKSSRSQLISISNDHLQKYLAQAHTVLLYEPAPNIIKL